MHQLETIINAAFEQRATLNSDNAEPAIKEAVNMVLAELNAGLLRVAEKVDGLWQVNQWVKKAVLLHFCLSNNTLINGQFTNYFDKVKLKYAYQTAEQFKLEQVRIVPPACIRDGVYIGTNCVIMPSYLNIGAYVDSRSMIDIWATVGSCAQIGKNCHISSNVCIGGVLEPLQANPVIIEDNCFVGTGAAIVEGVIVEEGAVIGMGVKIGQSTKIFDRETGEIYFGRVPAGAVVVPGSLPSKTETYNTECAIIVKTVDAKTRAKVSINELLRDA